MKDEVDQFLAFLVLNKGTVDMRFSSFKFKFGTLWSYTITALDDRNHYVFGFRGDDSIVTLGGNDVIFGGRGKDTIYAGDGDDYLNGGKDDDELFGQAGNDIIFGGKGFDHADGGSGSDVLYLGEGDDRATYVLADHQEGDHDVYYGGEGDDLLIIDVTDQGIDEGKAAEIEDLFNIGSPVDFSILGLDIDLVAISFERLEIVGVDENELPAGLLGDLFKIEGAIDGETLVPLESITYNEVALERGFQPLDQFVQTVYTNLDGSGTPSSLDLEDFFDDLGAPHEDIWIELGSGFADEEIFIYIIGMTSPQDQMFANTTLTLSGDRIDSTQSSLTIYNINEGGIIFAQEGVIDQGGNGINRFEKDVMVRLDAFEEYGQIGVGDIDTTYIENIFVVVDSM